MNATIQTNSSKTALLLFSAALMSIAQPTMAAEVQPHTINCLSVNSTPLCLAISRGDVAIVKKFVEYGADVNEKSNGMTPLMVAARYNNVEIVAYLLEQGADKDTKDQKGFTALKHAQLSHATDAEAFLRTH